VILALAMLALVALVLALTGCAAAPYYLCTVPGHGSVLLCVPYTREELAEVTRP
jgi:hypothetical protein